MTLCRCENTNQTNLILDDELKRMVKEHGRDYQAGFLHDNMDNAYIMPPTMNAVFLLSHMSGHFVNESIPLRMLYDWILSDRGTGSSSRPERHRKAGLIQ